MKTITIISLNYYPEDTAIGLYSTQMAEYLVDNGWIVNVISGFPYYPNWKISKNYHSKNTYIEESIKGVSVFRYKQYVPSKPTYAKRLLHILDFTFGSLINLYKIKQTDIVLSIIPFTSSAWLGKVLAKKTKAKHWIHIQDFEFDAVFESGMMKKEGRNKLFANILFKLESRLFNKADIVSSISNGMLKKLHDKTSTSSYYFPNWIDNSVIDPTKASVHKYLQSHKFKVLYSGNIGNKQDWDFFMELVDLFKQNNDIEFIIVGNGAYKKELIRKTKDFNNVIHYEPIPFSDLNDLLCSADLHILFQKPEVIDTVMPSKILGMMASEKPSIVTGNIMSEVAKVFEDSDGGDFIEANDVRKVESLIQSYMLNENLRMKKGINAKRYVISKFTKNFILNSFNNKLNSYL